ncbi:hypothetical protein E7681_03690 [Thalassobius vesicularis]|uniref:Uncharacterized protein n=1 Tax=Thalassobius vesicularis TaxID=1294297 RepID=A0A4V3UZ74_9RHOB|nr:hypothetical protein [Thalassobius vesicularis]THD75569.1 hypothetical protein E7681_03690 [Thalassobius vesicularis]
MTTTIAWLSYQNGAPSALTFASDSRLTWKVSGQTWDYGRKIYWCKSSPDIFGFAGDVVSQSTVVSQVCEIFDYSASRLAHSTPKDRHLAFVAYLQSATAEFPNSKSNGLHVLHGLRDGEGESCDFRLWRTVKEAGTHSWSDKELEFRADGKKNLVDDPGQFFGAGSGASKHRAFWERRIREAGNTSRSVFRALWDVIETAEDPMTGGLPQIASLGTTGFAKPVGFCKDHRRSVCGLPLASDGTGEDLEWRDENFRFLKPSSLKLKSNAPEHYFRR